MPEQNTGSSSPSPFEVISPSKSKKIGKKGIIVALSIILVLFLAVFLGVILVRQNQNIQEEAAKSQGANECPEVQACPYSKDPTLLINCTPPEIGTNPANSICNRAGRTESCGGRQFCCPAAGQAWTTDLTKCAASPTATATASATASATATATSSSSSTASATATATGSASASATAAATKVPVPVTGTDWPTYAGIGVGVFVIIGSLLLAL